MIVLVNGIGNIGTTLLNLLVNYQNELKVTEIYGHKRHIQEWENQEIQLLQQKGVKICTSTPGDGLEQLEQVLKKVNYIFETTENGVGLQNKERYNRLTELVGCSAQGSEKGFGTSFMSGVNNEIIEGEKFVHIVSCNTHGSAALIKTLAGNDLANLEKADMVVVRRSEDIGNHRRLVSANVVARHLDSSAGTHHAVDVIDLFQTIGRDLEITSSDITTPSQLMHGLRFAISLKKLNREVIQKQINENPYIASSKKFDSNIIFEMGRRYGFNGRIYSHAIVLTGNYYLLKRQLKDGLLSLKKEIRSFLPFMLFYCKQIIPKPKR
ncbi:MAG: hypothetical protein WDZ35_07470 [Crocinitomicaceae bacterium]